MDVRPGDQHAATVVAGWLQAYATSRDPVLRERIILAYLSLADRLAGRYRYSRGTTPEVGGDAGYLDGDGHSGAGA